MIAVVVARRHLLLFHAVRDALAIAAKWNSKVVRKALRLAFLAPDITEAVVLGSQPSSLGVSELQDIAAFSWDEQRRMLRFPAPA